MAIKRESAKKKKTQRKKSLPKQAILYLHVDRSTKAWLKAACRKQPGHVSQSTMIQRILKAAKTNPKFFTAVR
jgi:hypothetical protein